MKCVVCSKREPETPTVCGPDRWLMDLRLREVPVLAADLETQCDVAGDDWARDPVALLLPSGPVAGASREPRVGGSRERGVPARFDLLAPAYRRTEGMPGRREGTTDPYHDQVGSVSVAAILDSWCRDWITYDWCKADHLPVPTISALAGWLATRLQDACDHHPAMAEFAGELRDVHLALRQANGLTEPRPELCDGVPCRHCDQKALYRIPGSPWVECGGCSVLMTDEEYRAWTRLLASSVKREGEAA